MPRSKEQPVRLTILSENTVAPAPDILGEHGFSVLIERGDDCFLFDTGQGHCLLHNASCLKKDLRTICGIILSHGHFDHTGGVAQVLRLRGSVPVYCHPNVFSERFAKIKNGASSAYRSIGLPVSRKELEDLGASFVFTAGFSEIAPGLYLTGEVPRLSGFEKNDPRLVLKQRESFVQDSVPDDQSLVLDTKKGLVVVLGCAHAGIINTLTYIGKNLPGRTLHMVVGGTHLGYLDEKQLEATLEHLETFSIERIGVSHCTGLAPAAVLKQRFGNRFFFANVGSTITI